MAAVGDGPEVGRVSIRVIPKLKRFREDVEKELKSLPEGDVKIAPDTDGFKQKVKAQTKGLEARVDTKLNTSGLRSQAKAAAKAASGETVTFTTRTKQLGKVVSSGTAGIARRVNKQFAILASTLRLTGSAASLAGKSFRWATGGELVNRKIVSWLVQVRDKTYEVGEAAGTQLARPYHAAAKEVKKYGDAATKQVKKYGDVAKYALDGKRNDVYSQVIRLPLAYQRAKKSVRDYTDEVRRMSKGWHGHETANAEHASEQYRRVLKEMKSFYNKYEGFQRKSPEYDALNRREYNAILDLADKIRTSNTGSSQDLQELVARANDLHTRLGIADDELQEFDKHTKDVKKSFEDLDKARTWRNLAVRLDGTKNRMIEVRNRAREMGKSVKESVRGMANSVQESAQRMGNRIGESFGNSKVAAQLDKLRTNVTRLQDAVSRDTKTGNTKNAMKDFFSGFKRVKGDTVQVVDSIERVTRTTGRATGAMKKMGNQASGMGAKFKKMWGKFHQPENRIFGLTEMGWMALAITGIIAPLTGLIAGVGSALPALGAAFAAALGVGMLGWEGVKEAAEAAAPAFERSKEAMSAIARERLTPQFEQLGGWLDNTRDSMGVVAHGMSDFTQGFVNAATSAEGIRKSNVVLQETGKLFSDLQPFANSFTDGLMTMAEAGVQTFPKLSEGLNNFGEDFQRNMQKMFADGTLQAGIESTYDIIGSLVNNLGTILGAGLEELPNIAPGIVDMFDSIGQGLADATPMLGDITNGLTSAISGIADGIGGFAQNHWPAIAAIGEGLGPGFGEFVSGVTSLGGVALDGVTAFFSGLAPGMGEGLGGVGQALSEIAEGIRNIGDAESGLNSAGGGIGDFLSGIMDWSGYNTELQLNAAQIEEGLNMYGTAFTRGVMGNFGESGLVQLATRDIERSVQFFFGSLDEIQDQAQQSISKAQDALQIDLTPQIKKIDMAESRAEIQGILDETANMIREGTAESTRIEPEISFDPKINVEEGIAKLQEQSTMFHENLGLAIDQFTVDAQGLADANSIDITPQINVLQDANNLGEFQAAAQAIIDQINAEVSITPAPVDAQVDPNVEVTPGAGDQVGTQVESEINSALQGMNIDASAAAASIGTEIGSALGGVTVPSDGLADQLSSTISEAITTASATFEELTTVASTAGTSAAEGFTTGFSVIVEQASGKAGEAKGAVEGQLSGINLFSSGRAAGNSFANGLTASIVTVAAAAAAVAAAARAHFPNSPAKEGPFSGSNYVDRSGMAVAKDFAKGMESEIGAVEAAAGAVTGAARGKFDDFMVAPAGNMEAFKRQEILTPVLESNAKAIRNWRDRDAEMVEQHYERLAKNQENYQERVADIQARDSKQASKDKSLASQRENLAKNNAKAEEQLAERRAEAKQKMLDSLEAPEYRDIERSFRAYWLDGASNVIEEGLVDSMNEARIAERMKGLALRTVQRVRETFGNHPMLETVEASVQAEHFADTLERVLRESGIAEIPVNLVLANYDQLKSDLGMQDGVISRAMDAAIDYDPSATDARYARQNPVEIHYHVEDMEDAIRLEQQRERKEMLKIK